jgi:S-DNA-T family DNA segregation ATPase FtsK/SpoIIIE
MLKTVGLTVGLGAAAAIPLLRSINTNSDYTKLLKNCSIKNTDAEYPRIIKRERKEYGRDVVFSVPAGIELKNFIDNQNKFNQYLKSETHFYFDDSLGIVMKEYTGKLPHSINYPGVIIPSKPGLYLLIGMSRLGPLWIGLSDEAAHCLLAGFTGSGKSVLLRVLLTNCILAYPPAQLRIHLSDLKGGLELNTFEHIEHVDSFNTTVEGTKDILDRLIVEMYKRLDMFVKARVKNIDGYNQKAKDKLPRILLVIDEFTNLGRDKEAQGMLDELLMKARSQGIHIIASLQEPRAENIPGRLKDNFGATIALRAKNAIASRIIMDDIKAAYLRGNGHGILRSIEDTEFQGYWLSPDRAEQLIYKYQRATEPEIENLGGVLDYANYRKRQKNR